MKPPPIFAIGLGVGSAACAALLLWRQHGRDQETARMWGGILRMQGEGQLILARLAATSLASDAPDSCRDFANHVIDSGLLTERSGLSHGA